MPAQNDIKETLNRVLTWPLERQEEVARMVQVLETHEGEAYHPTDAEWEAIMEGFAQAQRDEYASDEELEALWRRHGL